MLDIVGYANILIKLGTTNFYDVLLRPLPFLFYGVIYSHSIVEGYLEPTYSVHTKPWACTKIPNLVAVDVHLRLASLSPLNIQSAHGLRYVQSLPGISPALTVTVR